MKTNTVMKKRKNRTDMQMWKNLNCSHTEYQREERMEQMEIF